MYLSTPSQLESSLAGANATIEGEAESEVEGEHREHAAALAQAGSLRLHVAASQRSKMQKRSASSRRTYLQHAMSSGFH